MSDVFREELQIAMYPSGLLHTFGVNGKISGSIGAIGEMQDVLPVIHSPRGCGYHYRCSARRRHQPFYDIYTSGLTEQEVIGGGEEKLKEAVRRLWQARHPGLIMLVPSPISDILNEDLAAVAAQMRREGIPAVSVKSELFSHRDKNYSRNHLKKLASQKVAGDSRLEMELKGCGFTEALYALVDQVMEETPKIPRSINIETIGWGSDGSRLLREMEAFLGQCGITVNTWIPSAPLDRLKKAPAAQLNLVKRIRWARCMQEKFGTPYLHLDSDGRYSGLEGICTFYRDVAQALQMEQEMEPLICAEYRKALALTQEDRAVLGSCRSVLMSRSISHAPFELKTYVRDYGMDIPWLCIILTPESRRSLGITPELEEQLLERAREAVGLYSRNTQIFLNPDEETLRSILSSADAVVGTGDFTLEGKGAPILPAVLEHTSLSFPSYVRTVHRLRLAMEQRTQKPYLLLNRMPFETRHYPLYCDKNNLAAKEMWARMWLNRKEGTL